MDIMDIIFVTWWFGDYLFKLAFCRWDHLGPKRELDQSYWQAAGSRFLCGRVVRRRTLPPVHQPHISGASSESDVWIDTIITHTIISETHDSHAAFKIVFTKATATLLCLGDDFLFTILGKWLRPVIQNILIYDTVVEFFYYSSSSSSNVYINTLMIVKYHVHKDLFSGHFILTG